MPREFSTGLALIILIVILFTSDTVRGKTVSPGFKLKVLCTVSVIIHCKPLATLVPLQVNVTLPGQYDPFVSGADVSVKIRAPNKIYNYYKLYY